MSRWLAPLIVALLLSVSSTTSPASAGPAADCGYPDVNAEGTITLTGTGQLNTRPFDLQARAYTVKWAGKAPGAASLSNLILVLKRTDGTVEGSSYPMQLLVNTGIRQGDPDLSGETQVYLMRGGAHYLDVTAPAGWTVTVSPQR